jgi:hypothetical protein
MSDASQCDTSRPTAPTGASSTDRTRRRFLFAFGASAAGAASAKALAATPVAAAPEANETTAQASGYRETQHVRTYYATTRI